MTYPNPTQGFTLIELMITIAIIGILSILALPLYEHYLERGYLLQAHVELININNGFKAILLKHPEQQAIKSNLDDYLAHYSGDKKIAEKYQYRAAMPSGDKNSHRYHLLAIPQSDDATMAIWMDSMGDAYRCTSITAAESFETSGDCEAISSKR